ncbi:MAG: hypothetical protein Q9164_006944 [Protoblastenia rupestris]
MLTKISICLFLLRIVDARRFKLALYGLIGFLVVFTAVFVFLFIGICRPLKAYWNIEMEDAVCLSDLQVQNIVIAQGGKLQIPLSTHTAACCIVRTALSGAMTDPDITCTPSLIPYLALSNHPLKLTLFSLGAITANVAWRLPEVNIGIVCANAPILRPLYLFFRGKLDSSKGARSYHSASKDRFVIPANNTQWAGEDATLRNAGGTRSGWGSGSTNVGSGWGGKGGKESTDESVVNLEMGLPGTH